MSSQGNGRTRRVFYPRRNARLDNVDFTSLHYNPYKKQYQNKTKKSTHEATTQLQYDLQIEPDNTWIGDKMLDKPSESCTRFWLQNARGLPTTLGGNLFRYDLTNIRNNNIHYYSMPESKINTSNSDITNHLMQLHQNIFGSGVLTLTNTPSFPTKHKHQPGGVASGFFGRLENRYSKTKKDDLGRWHYHEFFGKQNQLRIYTLYRVNPRPATNGDTTAWVQQQNILLQQGCTVNPRKKSLMI